MRGRWEPTMAKPIAGSMAAVRRINTSLVLDALRAAQGPMRVSALMDRTGLSRPTVEALTEALTAQGWLVESEGAPQPGRRSPGRPARTYEFNAHAGWVLGIDVGAHKVSACRADLRGTPRAWSRRPVTPSTPADERLEVARAAVDDVMADADASGMAPNAGGNGTGAGRAGGPGAPSAPILAASLATPGVVGPPPHRVLLAPALPDWDEVDFALWARDFLPCQLHVENDANLAVIAERAVGVARDREDVVFLLLGQRLGAGIITGGRVLRGHNGAAGEIGYAPLPGSPYPPAGFGPLEAHVNADAIVEMVTEEFARPGASTDSPLRRRFVSASDGEHVPAIATSAREGDPVALRVLYRLCQRLAEGIAPMLLVLNPDLVVLGGGISGVGDALRAPLRSALAGRLLFPPDLELSVLGDRAVVLGAVHDALARFEDTTLSVISA
ncbi:ROK family transcriptional regulator [Nocardiopsis rhodophaea]